MYALDTSSNNGQNIGPLLDQYKPQHLITKLYQGVELGGQGARYSIAHAEAARMRAITVGGYVWLYAVISGEQQVASALDTARRAGITLGPTNPLWLDCEDYVDPVHRDKTYPSLQTIHEAVDACATRGVACGIYTGGWWWRPRTVNSQAFAGLPLWASIYDENAQLVAPNFGGWQELAGKQFSGSPVDRSMFRARYASAA